MIPTRQRSKKLSNSSDSLLWQHHVRRRMESKRECNCYPDAKAFLKHDCRLLIHSLIGGHHHCDMAFWPWRISFYPERSVTPRKWDPFIFRDDVRVEGLALALQSSLRWWASSSTPSGRIQKRRLAR